MTCREVEALILPYAAGKPIPPEAAAHIAGCATCTALVRAMQRPNQPLTPSTEQLQRIKAGLLANLKPVKPLAPAGVLFVVVMFIAAVVAAVGVSQLGTAGWQALSLLQRTTIFTTLSAGAMSMALTLVGQIVPGSRLPFDPRVAAAAIFGILAGIFATTFRVHEEPAFVATGLVCLRIGLECAGPVMVLCWLLLRRGAVMNPRGAGAVSGALAGLSALCLLEIFCPNPNEYHVLVWHMGAALAATGLGTAIGILVDRVGGRPPARVAHKA